MCLRIVVLLTLISCSAFAKVFRNAYVSFEMPDTWDCKLEHTEWVCRNNLQDQSREAIVILTAKEVGPSDSFAAYRSHLAQPLQPGYKGAGSAVSQVKYQPKEVLINNQTWIDGLHLGSEIPGYFTQYLATLKDRIAILITFSAHKNYYTKYSGEFFKSVKSLRVISTANLLNQQNAVNLRPATETLGTGIGQAIPEGFIQPAQLEDGGGGGGRMKAFFFLLAVILAAIAGYIFYKSKSK